MKEMVIEYDEAMKLLDDLNNLFDTLDKRDTQVDIGKELVARVTRILGNNNSLMTPFEMAAVAEMAQFVLTALIGACDAQLKDIDQALLYLVKLREQPGLSSRIPENRVTELIEVGNRYRHNRKVLTGSNETMKKGLERLKEELKK